MFKDIGQTIYIEKMVNNINKLIVVDISESQRLMNRISPMPVNLADYLINLA